MRYRLVVEGPWGASFPLEDAEDSIAYCRQTYICPAASVATSPRRGQFQRLELLDDDGTVLASWSEGE